MNAHYLANKKWRLNNPKKRNKSKDRHYKLHVYKGMNSEKYSSADEELILTKMLDGKKYLDREIAALIGRTLKAIQIKRCKLKKNMEK